MGGWVITLDGLTCMATAEYNRNDSWKCWCVILLLEGRKVQRWKHGKPASGTVAWQVEYREARIDEEAAKVWNPGA